MTITFTLDQIQETAEQILAQNPSKIILFNGEMGVGKTTLIKQLCKSLGITDATSSPTFSLVNEYQIPNGKKVYHFDFYRIKQETEALDMGVDDYLYSGNWCFIEWSEKIESLIPEEHSTISIELLEDGKRELKLQ
ncbi:tRNA (adenosine(37)-N6)-threonylcarbamoyltransferase complex ATPase subunit type 1 TsaE [Flavobacterium hungaricum]|uniref:tRNA threonylcarbamoyladenosine biosynthesis protein TsaE n=1 Tax=Flavobacterium hungaricum TaxID=2082725 RepID=A0ABR9TH87_9FLAO|nr:tRNA (adenosine(37)-N6)-threonylcarbamoyltransferase complex ATPase subunit type 1 TsaE [Flavobacterium hungaricum]MBE8724630.1 tRNA (adenosine(37)-N6)-threonylcarbamoyltransferase complex ATPase subunit type 1 TsaE [Flavobacterium hungaricum]